MGQGDPDSFGVFGSILTVILYGLFIATPCLFIWGWFMIWGLLLWVIVNVPTLIPPLPPAPPPPPDSRAVRRRMKLFLRRKSKARPRLRSYRDCVHRSFPVRLRILRFYPDHPPTLLESAASASHIATYKALLTDLSLTLHRDRIRCQKEAQARQEGDRTRTHVDRVVDCLPTFCFGCVPPSSSANECDDEQYRTLRAEVLAQAISTPLGVPDMDLQALVNSVDFSTNLNASFGDESGAQRALQAHDTLPLDGSAFLAHNPCAQAVYDTGASCHIFNDASLFSSLEELPNPIPFGGVSSVGVTCRKTGIVPLRLKNIDGTWTEQSVQGFYVPAASRNLISFQSLIGTLRHEQLTDPVWQSEPAVHGRVHHTGVDIVNLHHGQEIRIPIDPASNLPIGDIFTPQPGHQELEHELHLCVTSSSNANLSEPAKELLRWHIKLGHINFDAVRLLLARGVLASSVSAQALHRRASAVKKVDTPRCASCQFGKQTRTPKPGISKQQTADSKGSLMKNVLVPGQRVFVDHFVCGTPGRLESGFGKSAAHTRYKGGSIWYDAASGSIYCGLQVHLTSHETLLHKHKYEQWMRDHGHVVTEYVSDGGSCFTSADYLADLRKFRQHSIFAAPGAHHTNGPAERAIGVITAMARTMMLHAGIRWPEMADPDLWALAINHAVYLYNRLPKKHSGMAPIEILSGTKWGADRAQHLHVWGCPTYVLDPQLQNGAKIPRWTPRSRRGVYMGVSTRYATSAPLVLNLRSGSITSQHHCIFDDWFTTTTADSDSIPDFSSSPWDSLFDTRYWYTFDDDDPPALATEWSPTFLQHSRRAAAVRQSMDATAVPNSSATPVPPRETGKRVHFQREPSAVPDPSTARSPSPSLQRESPPLPAPQRESSPPPSPQREYSPPPSPQRESYPPPSPQRESSPPPLQEREPSSPQPRRSQRQTHAPQRFAEEHGTLGSSLSAFHAEVTKASSRPSSQSCAHPDADPSHQYLQYVLEMDPADRDVAVEALIAIHDVLLAKKNTDPDTLRYSAAMHAPDSDKFIDAMDIEVDGLIREDTFEIVPKASVQEQIVPSTWTYRRKRQALTRVIKKHKARLCLRGDLEHAEEDTFAPLVHWSTIRALMVMTLSLELETECIDFSNAFVQATLPKPAYMGMPRGAEMIKAITSRVPDGYALEDCCMKLKKSLYGSKLAPKRWYQHLRTKLESLDCHPSKHDPCLFHGRGQSVGITLVVYCDDLILVCKDKSKLNTLIERMQGECKLTLTREGELTEYLGIDIVRDRERGTFELRQMGLIDQVLENLGMTDCNPCATPADTTPVGRCLEEDLMTDEWVYASVVGQMLYLANNSRPDIAYAVNSACRHTHSPRKSHAIALKRIARYLKGTRERGLIMKPANHLGIDCYCDSDFMGLWKSEKPTDPICVRSRTGYVITLAGCPLTWTSKLQTDTATSTMHAEYTALSQSLRELLPLKEVVKEIASKLGYSSAVQARTHSTIFEDNMGALILANKPHDTPRSKFYALKLHHFREHVQNGSVVVVKVDSRVNPADGFTKGLDKIKFRTFCYLLMRWRGPDYPRPAVLDGDV